MNLKEFNEFRMTDAVKFHSELNPELFDGDHLNTDVRQQLLVIAEDFIDYLGVSDLDIDDIRISGSNAAYTYTDHSDIDLHILVDFKKLYKSDVYSELFNSKKIVYNDTHNIKIRGYDVELYVQDSNQKIKSLGEYSVKNNRWVKFPIKRQANLDQHSTSEKFKKLVQLSELALRSNDIERVGDLLYVLKKYRRAGLDEHGEFGPENLAYKALRTRGIVDKLFKHRDHLRSRELSLDEMLDEMMSTHREPLVWLKGKLKGSYTDQQLKSLGARIVNGNWAMPKSKYDELIKSGRLQEGASGYIPSNAEKNDPRFKTALTVDVKPDTLKKSAKQLGFKVSRAGIPPLLRK
jgi:hypothetical protein